jgi:outer membrane murein-binding lipoprotein Lpp
MGIGPGWPQPSAWWNCRRVIVLFLAVLLLSACSPPNQANQKKAAKLSQEIKALKAQIAAMQNKLDKLQGGQQAILAMLKQPAPAPSPQPVPPSAVQIIPGAPPALPPLTVGQLLASKDRYLGARVTVKGVMGPVLMHHQSFMLQSPQGMVEVLFGNLADPKTIQTLTNTPMENKTVTVTGVVTLSPAQGAGAQLQIRAEAVQF